MRKRTQDDAVVPAADGHAVSSSRWIPAFARIDDRWTTSSPPARAGSSRRSPTNCSASAQPRPRRPTAASRSRASARSPTTPISSRGSRAASCGASAAGRYRNEHGRACARQGDRLADAFPRRSDAARRRRRDALAAREPRVRDADDQGRRSSTAFARRSGSRPSIDKRAPDVRVHAYLTADEATFYLDTSGEPLFKRGYRRDAEDAPIRENLAAGLVVLSGWQPGSPLLDPMCGSGTIAIEAAMIAAGRAPGLARTFGFQKLAWYDGPTWQRIRQKALDRVAATSIASLRSSRATLRRPPLRRRRRTRGRPASTRGCRSKRRRPRRVARPQPRGVLIANPPYGVRLADQQKLAAFYPAAR